MMNEQEMSHAVEKIVSIRKEPIKTYKNNPPIKQSFAALKQKPVDVSQLMQAAAKTRNNQSLETSKTLNTTQMTSF